MKRWQRAFFNRDRPAVCPETLMDSHIRLELLATLKRYQPVSSDRYPVEPGITVRELIEKLGIPEYEVNLVFIDGIKGNLDSTIEGGERIALFPPLGGG